MTDLLVDIAGPLAVHAEYTRDEILVGLGRWDMDRRPRFTEGVLHLADRKVDAFFVGADFRQADLEGANWSGFDPG